MRAYCSIDYPGSDGINRTTEAILTTDHAASSYGLPVIVVEPASERDHSLDPLIDAVAGAHGIGAIAGSLAERLAAGVYGPADLPTGAMVYPHYRLVNDDQTYDDLDALFASARRAGYPVATR